MTDRHTGDERGVSAKLAWKDSHRQLRIVRREVSKQMTDAMLYGAGFVEIGLNIPGNIRHVPIEKWVSSRQKGTS